MLKSLAKLSNILAETHKDFRSSRPKLFYKKGVLRNVASACNFIKKGTLALKIFDVVPNIGKETVKYETSKSAKSTTKVIYY